MITIERTAFNHAAGTVVATVSYPVVPPFGPGTTGRAEIDLSAQGFLAGTPLTVVNLRTAVATVTGIALAQIVIAPVGS